MCVAEQWAFAFNIFSCNIDVQTTQLFDWATTLYGPCVLSGQHVSIHGSHVKHTHGKLNNARVYGCVWTQYGAVTSGARRHGRRSRTTTQTNNSVITN